MLSLAGDVELLLSGNEVMQGYQTAHQIALTFSHSTAVNVAWESIIPDCEQKVSV